MTLPSETDTCKCSITNSCTGKSSDARDRYRTWVFANFEFHYTFQKLVIDTKEITFIYKMYTNILKKNKECTKHYLTVNVRWKEKSESI